MSLVLRNVSSCLSLYGWAVQEQPSISLFLTCFAYFKLESLAVIANALALIRIRFPERSQICRHLTYLLLINTGQGNLGLLLINCSRNPLRQLELNRM